jgi:hypothetical protein
VLALLIAHLLGSGLARSPWLRVTGRTRKTRAVRRGGRHAGPTLRVGAPAVCLLLLVPALALAATAGDSVTVRWTATGDDGNVGTAAVYDLRMSGEPITLASWEQATAIDGLPAPLPAGSAQSVVVHGLTSGTTYYFAIRVRDDAGNWSDLSNVVRWDGLDTAPPAAPAGLTATRNGSGGVELCWQPCGAPDLAGYSVYRAIQAGGPYTKLNTDLLTTTEYLDTSPPADATSLLYEVTATNASGHESPRSPSVDALAAAGGGGLAWAIETPYPNPSRVSEPVRIPVVLEGGSARLDIVDAAEHLVRRIGLDGAGSGPREITWDGRNDAARPVAPGPYRVWLVAGDRRVCARLVRLP